MGRGEPEGGWHSQGCVYVCVCVDVAREGAEWVLGEGPWPGALLGSGGGVQAIWNLHPLAQCALVI